MVIIDKFLNNFAEHYTGKKFLKTPLYVKIMRNAGDGTRTRNPSVINRVL